MRHHGRRSGGKHLLIEGFPYPNGLVTNEYAFRHTSPYTNNKWEMDSGTLYASNGVGYTGVPDDTSPNIGSTNGNNSQVFRLTSKAYTFGNVRIQCALKLAAWTSSAGHPEQDTDGVHVFARYQSQDDLYALSVVRRDNTCVIKKKVNADGGTYYTLGTGVARTAPSIGVWTYVRCDIRTIGTTCVLSIWINNSQILERTDNGVSSGGAIHGPGAVGLRIDNLECYFASYVVDEL